MRILIFNSFNDKKKFETFANSVLDIFDELNIRNTGEFDVVIRNKKNIGKLLDNTN